MASGFSVASEVRRIVALAAPVVLTGLNWTLLQVTDVAVVGMVSTREAAALGASRSITFVGIVTGLAWLSGVLVFAARADGAGDRGRADRVLRAGVALATLLGVGLGAALIVGGRGDARGGRGRARAGWAGRARRA